MSLWKWAIAVSIAGNQLANAITGGKPDETISARAEMAREHGNRFAAGVCHVLNAVDHHHEIKGEDHCAKAIRHQHERQKRQR